MKKIRIGKTTCHLNNSYKPTTIKEAASLARCVPHGIRTTIAHYLAGKRLDDMPDSTAMPCFVGMIETGEATYADFDAVEPGLADAVARVKQQMDDVRATQMKYSEPELNAAFKRVQNPDDWRAPISRAVQVENIQELNLIIEAIMFYTATKAEVFRLDPHLSTQIYHITAAGYRNGPAGP